jgi:TRAP-type C4-dicarboxylate transport system substrate-binding protein
MTARAARSGALRRSALSTSLIIVSACGNTQLDRGVGDQPERISLTFADVSHNPGSELQSFADAVARLSKDTVRIEFRGGAHANDVQYETAIIKNVEDGRFDLGWAAPRPWHAMGMTTFDALAAPLLVDSYALQEAVLDSEVADAMLDGLDGSGLVGLGILPGPMRIIGAADRPFLRPDDFHGATVAIQDSAIAVSTFEALGATTTAIRTGGAIDGADAIEQQASSMVGNSYDRVMTHVTVNLSLWPRPLILFANEARFDSLTDKQREAMRLAAREVASSAKDSLERGEQAAISILCDRGVDIVTASAADLSTLRDAVQQVYGQLEQDPATAQHIAAIIEMKAQLGASDAPGTCADVAASPSTGQPAAVGFPDGIYETQISAEDVKDRPQDSGCPCTWGFTLDDGSFMVADPNERPTRVEFFGDHMTLPDWKGPNASITVRWVFDEQSQAVTFSEMVGGTDDDRFVFERTWVKAD